MPQNDLDSILIESTVPDQRAWRVSSSASALPRAPAREGPRSAAEAGRWGQTARAVRVGQYGWGRPPGPGRNGIGGPVARREERPPPGPAHGSGPEPAPAPSGAPCAGVRGRRTTRRTAPAPSGAPYAGVRASGTGATRRRSTRLTRVRHIEGCRRQGPPERLPDLRGRPDAAPAPARTRTASPAGTAAVPPPGHGGAAVPAHPAPQGTAAVPPLPPTSRTAPGRRAGPGG